VRLVVFSKMLKDLDVSGLISLAHEHGFDGYDLCVRPGHPVNPDNVSMALVEAVRAMRGEGLEVPMLTGNFDLVTPDHPAAELILAAMDRADVRLLKLGYFHIDPHQQDYWTLVDEIRAAFEGWQRLAARYQVKVCYHTHSGAFMGLNCAALMHLLQGLDPRYVGAYTDPGHMTVNGEDFPLGLAMVKRYLSAVAVKDVLLVREEADGHGKAARHFVPAGQGMVDWTVVFAELARVGFTGPLSIHCEFEVPRESFMPTFAREIDFFRRQRDRALGQVRGD